MTGNRQNNKSWKIKHVKIVNELSHQSSMQYRMNASCILVQMKMSRNIYFNRTNKKTQHFSLLSLFLSQQNHCSESKLTLYVPYKQYIQYNCRLIVSGYFKFVWVSVLSFYSVLKNVSGYSTWVEYIYKVILH